MREYDFKSTTRKPKRMRDSKMNAFTVHEPGNTNGPRFTFETFQDGDTATIVIHMIDAAGIHN